MLVSLAEIEKDREERHRRAKDTLLSRGMSTAQVGGVVYLLYFFPEMFYNGAAETLLL